jgi:hypothetical protein
MFWFLFLILSFVARTVLGIHPGIVAPDSEAEFHSVVKVESAGGAYGSAVFLNQTTALSVAHATDPKFPGGNVQVRGIAATNVFGFPAYHRIPTPDGNPSPHDIVVIVFPAGTAKNLGITKFHPVATVSPKFDERVTLVGFAGGDRKYGDNTFLFQDEQFVYGLGHAPGSGKPGKFATVEGGDSGGPLWNSLGEIFGISTWTWWVPEDAVPARVSVFIRIRKTSVQHLFEDAIHCRAPKYPKEVAPYNMYGPCAENFPGSEI